MDNSSVERVNTGVKDGYGWKQMGAEEKTIAIHEEIRRMNQLPSRSSYATHRLRVLDKILYLLNAERSASHERELELLFAGLSL